MGISEGLAEELRQKTVAVLLTLRNLHLAGGGNKITHWELLQNRALSAAKRSTSPAGWATKLAQGLQVASLNTQASAAVLALAEIVRDRDCAMEWLQLVEEESAYLMARTRKASEQRREAQETS